jgi:hypothetical protein
MLTLYFAVCLFTSQYHRSMREFTVAVRHMAAQVVTEDEIANAAGNYLIKNLLNVCVNVGTEDAVYGMLCAS